MERRGCAHGDDEEPDFAGDVHDCGDQQRVEACDRIEAATYAIAAAATNGKIRLRGARADHLRAVLDKLQDSGAAIERCGADITVSRKGRLKPVDITTLPYSGFPTDVQAQMMALMALTPGISIITERIFESRFMHVSELSRLASRTGGWVRRTSG